MFLMYYTCKLKLKYSMIKIIVMTLCCDFRYIKWLYGWLKSNQFALWSVPLMVCILLITTNLTAMLYNKQILSRSVEVLFLTPVLWASFAGLINFLLPRAFDK